MISGACTSRVLLGCSVAGAFIDLLDPAAPGSTNTFATAINDEGQVVGYSGVDISLPLPAALPLFATGLAGLGLIVWSRKKAAAG